MGLEKAVGLIALSWLVVSVLLMARSVRRGRDLADVLATGHPEVYEKLGRPRPGFFESVRRTRFAQFVGSREFKDLPDESLSAEFEEFRKSEARLVVSILASGVLLAVLTLAIRHAA